MSAISFSRTLIITDQVTDYIPIVSTITNLVDLFIKYVILPLLNKATITNNHYFTYINNKDDRRCLISGIPFFGNISVGIYDLSFTSENNEPLPQNKTLDEAARLKDEAILLSRQNADPTALNEAFLKAENAYRALAKQGNSEAIEALALLLFRCNYQSSDLSKKQEALIQLEKAAHLGHRSALLSLAFCYVKEIFVAKSLEKAEEYYTLLMTTQNESTLSSATAFKTNYPDKDSVTSKVYVEALIFICCASTKNEDPNNQTASHQLIMSCKKDHDSALLKLANCYTEGFGVDKDLAEAKNLICLLPSNNPNRKLQLSRIGKLELAEKQAKLKAEAEKKAQLKEKAKLEAEDKETARLEKEAKLKAEADLKLVNDTLEHLTNVNRPVHSNSNNQHKLRFKVEQRLRHTAMQKQT
ncbi:MAG: hypothetical protein P4L16_00980 [Chlamydiales bacterium]|nr:hypothetical protein [Chlamydiales bacterium]